MGSMSASYGDGAGAPDRSASSHEGGRRAVVRLVEVRCWCCRRPSLFGEAGCGYCPARGDFQIVECFELPVVRARPAIIVVAALGGVWMVALLVVMVSSLLAADADGQWNTAVATAATLLFASLAIVVLTLLVGGIVVARRREMARRRIWSLHRLALERGSERMPLHGSMRVHPSAAGGVLRIENAPSPGEVVDLPIDERIDEVAAIFTRRVASLAGPEEPPSTAPPPIADIVCRSCGQRHASRSHRCSECGSDDITVTIDCAWMEERSTFVRELSAALRFGLLGTGMLVCTGIAAHALGSRRWWLFALVAAVLGVSGAAMAAARGTGDRAGRLRSTVLGIFLFVVMPLAAIALFGVGLFALAQGVPLGVVPLGFAGIVAVAIVRAHRLGADAPIVSGPAASRARVAGRVVVPTVLGRPLSLASVAAIDALDPSEDARRIAVRLHEPHDGRTLIFELACSEADHRGLVAWIRAMLADRERDTDRARGPE
jgi:hypothetical protein